MNCTSAHKRIAGTPLQRHIYLEKLSDEINKSISEIKQIEEERRFPDVLITLSFFFILASIASLFSGESNKYILVCLYLSNMSSINLLQLLRS